MGASFLAGVSSLYSLEYIELVPNLATRAFGGTEISSTVHQEFEITARRKKVRRLEQIGAFNIAIQLSCQSDTKELPIPKPMKKFIKMYLDTFSARSEILVSSSFPLPPTPRLLLLEVPSTNLITLEVGECVGDLVELELCLVLVHVP
jgi:hypothetical protein